MSTLTPNSAVVAPALNAAVRWSRLRSNERMMGLVVKAVRFHAVLSKLGVRGTAPIE